MFFVVSSGHLLSVKKLTDGQIQVFFRRDVMLASRKGTMVDGAHVYGHRAVLDNGRLTLFTNQGERRWSADRAFRVNEEGELVGLAMFDLE